MAFDYTGLRKKIKEVYKKQDEFAKALGIGRVSLSQRLTNKLDFSQSEIFNGSNLLNINSDEIPIYFFTTKVQKHEQLKQSETN